MGGGSNNLNFTSTGSITFTGFVGFGSAGRMFFNGRAGIQSPADGVLTLQNNAITDFNRLQFGGTTSSFPALKRSSAKIQARLADDSAYADFDAANLTLSGAISSVGDAATSRTALGLGSAALSASSDFQAADATLTALAGANWAANAVPIGSGADTLSQVSFAANTFPARASTGNLVAKSITDAALSLLDDADAAAMRTTLSVSAHVPMARYSSGTAQIGLPGRTFRLAPALTGASIQNIRVYTAFCVTKAATVLSLTCEVTTQDATPNEIRMGIVAADNNLQPTGAMLGEGSATTAGTGVKTVTLGGGSGVVLQPGWYLTGIATNSTTVRFRYQNIAPISTVWGDALLPQSYSVGSAYPTSGNWGSPVTAWTTEGRNATSAENAYVMLSWTP